MICDKVVQQECNL